MICDVCEKPAVYDILVGRFCDACLAGINKAITSMNALPEHAACGNCVNARPNWAYACGGMRPVCAPDRRWCSLLQINVSTARRCQHWIRSSAPTSAALTEPSDPPTGGPPSAANGLTRLP